MATKQATKMSFEEALGGLEKAADALKREETTLEEAIHSYEVGIRYYKWCSEILDSAKQKIQIFDQEEEQLKDF